MQRVFRGHCGRKHAAQARKNLLAQRQSLLFSYFATVIQSRFRGFYSRRYRHDFFARKRYIQGILDRSEALRKQLNEHAAAQAEVRACVCAFACVHTCRGVRCVLGRRLNPKRPMPWKRISDA